MPPLTRWFIKTALIYLVLALVFGVLILAGPALQRLQHLAGLTTLYFHLLMVGWITQLIFGVANWMFPIYTRENPRRSTTLGWLSYLLLNTGMVVRIGADIILVLDSFPLPVWTTGIGALFLFASALAFAVNIWHRVKGH